MEGTRTDIGKIGKGWEVKIVRPRNYCIGFRNPIVRQVPLASRQCFFFFARIELLASFLF
jgi:hypothetical protein